MRSYAVLVKCSVMLAAACILFCGCTDKKRIAELEQTNQALESRVAKLDNDLTLASNALRAKQAEVANLQTQMADMQAKMTELQKASEKKAAPVAAKKSAPTAKKSVAPTARKKATSPTKKR